MNIAVRYQSQGGNTKKVAEAIAKAAIQAGLTGVTAEPISRPITKKADLLIVCGGVYKWGLDKSLVTYLEKINPKMVKKVAAVTTAGGMNKTKDIEKIVKAKGIDISGYNLSVLFMLKNHALLGGKGQIELNEKQIEKINMFVSNIIAEPQNN